jgi:hypothetical protein
VNRLTTVSLFLVLCLVATTIPTASAASRPMLSTRTALVSCLQREYLMRDVYQNIFAKYPALTAFGTVLADEVAMISTLKKVFAKYRVPIPIDERSSFAQALANTATSISIADAVAINLEQSTATMMTQLLQKTDSHDVLDVIVLIKTASLGSHTAAFAVEQTSVSVPAPVPLQRVVSFTPSQTAATLLALLRDESIDVIELSGTYRLPYTVINIDRTRPVVVRPVAGKTVVLSGANIGSDPQFEFGDGGTAGNITMQGFIFDGYVLGQQGIIQACDTHDLTLNDMVVRNSRANGTYAQPYHAWAIYLSSTLTVRSTNFTANRWIVDGSARQMGALQVYGGSHITAIGWVVSSAFFAVYACSERGPLTDFILDDWTINDTGSSDLSVSIDNASGIISNMHATSSEGLRNRGNPMMIDGGGNIFQ